MLTKKHSMHTKKSQKIWSKRCLIFVVYTVEAQETVYS